MPGTLNYIKLQNLLARQSDPPMGKKYLKSNIIKGAAASKKLYSYTCGTIEAQTNQTEEIFELKSLLWINNQTFQISCCWKTSP